MCCGELVIWGAKVPGSQSKSKVKVGKLKIFPYVWESLYLYNDDEIDLKTMIMVMMTMAGCDRGRCGVRYQAINPCLATNEPRPPRED